MSDLTDHVADALFQAEIPDPLGLDSATTLATVALQAARAQGWRIAKTGDDGIRHGSKPHVAVFEEWTGG